MPKRRWFVSLDGVTRTVEIRRDTPAGITEALVDGKVVARDAAASLDGVLWRWRTSIALPFRVGGHRLEARVRPHLPVTALALVVDGRDAASGGPAQPLERPAWVGGGAALPRPLLPPGAPALATEAPTVAARLRRAGLLVAGFGVFLLATTSADVADNLRFARESVAIVVDLDAKAPRRSPLAGPEVTYRTVEAGRTVTRQLVVDDGYWLDARIPSRVGARYLPADPLSLRLDGARDEWRRVEWTALAAAAALLVAARFLAAARHREEAAEHVWRSGEAVDAVVVGFERYARRGPDGGWLWSLRYAYRDAALRRYEGTSEYLVESDAARYAPGERVGVRYDPSRPAASVWAGAGS